MHFAQSLVDSVRDGSKIATTRMAGEADDNSDLDKIRPMT
ncbi:hypothetical protein TrRE_jg10268, partial [Triparma retinervis]